MSAIIKWSSWVGSAHRRSPVLNPGGTRDCAGDTGYADATRVTAAGGAASHEQRRATSSTFADDSYSPGRPNRASTRRSNPSRRRRRQTPDTRSRVHLARRAIGTKSRQRFSLDQFRIEAAFPRTRIGGRQRFVKSFTSIASNSTLTFGPPPAVMSKVSLPATRVGVSTVVSSAACQPSVMKPRTRTRPGTSRRCSL